MKLDIRKKPKKPKIFEILMTIFVAIMQYYYPCPKEREEAYLVIMGGIMFVILLLLSKFFMFVYKYFF